MQPQQNNRQKSVFKSSSNVRSSQIFYNITDEDMNDFFMEYIEQGQQKQQNQNQNQNQTQNEAQNQKQKQNQNRNSTNVGTPEHQKPNIMHVQYFDDQVVNLKDQSDRNNQNIVNERDKDVVTRLQIQVEKNQLNFQSVYGEIFIMIVKAQLISQTKKQMGKLLITNYRFAFFKNRAKKLDLPYGFISQCRTYDKQLQIVAQLKYEHFWRLKINDLKSYNNLKIFLQIYLKIENIRSCFAFNYALKHPDLNSIKRKQLMDEFDRMGYKYKQIHAVDNSQFSICFSYPEIIYLPLKISSNAAHRIARFWNENRLPVLTYSHIFNKPKNEELVGIWRSSAITCDRSEQLKDVAKFLQLIRDNKQKLTVFDSGFKHNKRGLQQFQINSQCQMRYLQIDSTQNIKASYLALVQSFLVPKKTYIKDVISSKWYDLVLQFLRGASEIGHKILNKQSVIIKCLNGRDRSPILSALAQIIICPFYRTIQGFEILVQKQFRYFGFPFLSRLGFTYKKQQQCPLFIIFLDCVSQLLCTNQMCFQYNYKYLSKLSNLMYTCLFGTFITNSRKQQLENNVNNETFPIWGQLISQLVKNACYFQKTGVLQIPETIDQIRIWKQHFGYLTTPPKQTYKIHPLAEDNNDYTNLKCYKLILQNKVMQEQIQKQKKTIELLKSKLAGKTQPIQVAQTRR